MHQTSECFKLGRLLLLIIFYGSSSKTLLEGELTDRLAINKYSSRDSSARNCRYEVDGILEVDESLFLG